jgi:hypothetical protein
MKNEKPSKTLNKEAIRAEYAAGGVLYRELAEKYQCSIATVHIIVHPEKAEARKLKSKEQRLLKLASTPNYDPAPREIALLQQALREERVKNKLLNAMIDIAEENLKVPIRKKAGAKRS